MKPVAFDYCAPHTLPEALAALAGGTGGAVPLAGGQSLMPLLAMRRRRPRTVVDLNRLPGLDGVVVTAGTVRIGAMTRMRALEIHEGLRAALPVLPEAVVLVAHQQIRYRGTLGGSLCHGDPSAELPTLAVALDATLRLESVSGTREVPASAFYAGAHPALRPDELLTEVAFPRPAGLRCCFEEVTRRGGAGYPLVGVCLGVVTADGVVTAARLAAGGVADRPLRLAAAEERLVGTRLGAASGVRADGVAYEVPSDVLDAATAGLDPPDDLHGGPRYRAALLRTLIRRAASRLAGPPDPPRPPGRSEQGSPR